MDGDLLRKGGGITLAFLFLLLAGCGTDDGTSSTNDPTEAPESWSIQVMLATSGRLSSTTGADSAALQLAVEDLRYGDFTGIDPVDVTLNFFDTESDASTAADLMNQMEQGDPPIVIGPTSSASTSAALSVADSRDLILLSPTATAPSLAIEGDNLFRLCPDDRLQASALVRVLARQGVGRVVVVHRDDLYGADLAEVLEDTLSSGGIELVGMIAYSGETFDSRVLADSLQAVVSEMNLGFGVTRSAIILVGYSELADLIHDCYGSLLLQTVDWYATDGFATDPVLVADSAAAAFAESVTFYASSFVAEESQRYLYVQQRLSDALGYDPAPSSIFAYDCLLLAAYARQELGADCVAEVYRDSLAVYSRSLPGVSGDCTMNDAGDRASAGFGFYTVIENTDGTFDGSLSIRE